MRRCGSTARRPARSRRACSRCGSRTAGAGWCSTASSGPAGGAPPSANRRQRLDEYRASNRRPIDEAFIWSIFTRDHPGSAHDDVVDVFAREACKLDTSVPNGTYVDMCANLPLVDPTRLDLPVLVLRG